MKKFLIFAMSIGLMLAGCDFFPNIAIDDLEGTQVFGSKIIKEYSADNVTLFIIKSDDTSLIVDLWWHVADSEAEAGYVEYQYTCSGTISKNIFKANTYDSYGTAYNNVTTTHGAIEVEFSMKDDKVIAKFSGDGPLNGVTISDGIKQ